MQSENFYKYYEYDNDLVDFLTSPMQQPDEYDFQTYCELNTYEKDLYEYGYDPNEDDTFE